MRLKETDTAMQGRVTYVMRQVLLHGVKRGAKGTVIERVAGYNRALASSGERAAAGARLLLLLQMGRRAAGAVALGVGGAVVVHHVPAGGLGAHAKGLRAHGRLDAW